jgi:hypothetical protein
MLSLHIGVCVHHNNNHSFCYNKEKKEGHGKYLFLNSWLSSLDIIIKILQDYISTCNYFSLCVKTQCGIHVIGYWWIAESFLCRCVICWFCLTLNMSLNVTWPFVVKVDYAYMLVLAHVSFWVTTRTHHHGKV